MCGALDQLARAAKKAAALGIRYTPSVHEIISHLFNYIENIRFVFSSLGSGLWLMYHLFTTKNKSNEGTGEQRAEIERGKPTVLKILNVLLRNMDSCAGISFIRHTKYVFGALLHHFRFVGTRKKLMLYNERRSYFPRKRNYEAQHKNYGEKI